MQTVIPNEAIAYIAKKKLKTAFHWHEVYADEHQHSFTVAKVMETDLLSELHQGVQQAIEKGQTFQIFKRDLLKNLGESGWGAFKQIDEKTGEVITRLSDKRLRKIYQTNITQARNHADWQRFQETKKDFPYLQYRLGSSVHHREAHVQFAGLVLPVDDHFWDTHMPMNGWGCKCWVQQLTEEKAQAIGISESPKIEYHDWVNPETGEVKKVPKGLSPGFEYNVGKYRNRSDLALISDKITNYLAIDKKLATGLFEGVFEGVSGAYLEKAFSDWVKTINREKQARGQVMAVGLINEKVMTKLEQLNKAPEHPIIAVRDKDIIHALRDTKQEKGFNLPIEFWQQLPEKLKNPTAILLQTKDMQRAKNATDNLLFIFETEKGKVAIKMDYEIHIKDISTGEKHKVKLNMVRTGSYLNLSDKDVLNSLKGFTLLWGNLN